MKKLVSILVVLFCSANIFATNPADLTVFDRHYKNTFIKEIYEKNFDEFCVILPLDEYNFSLDIVQYRNEGNSRSYTGRLVRKFSENLDASFIATEKINDGKSTKARATLDFHGDLFGTKAGLGLLFPLNEEDSFKIGPRVKLGDFTTFLTLGEEKECLAGISYCKAGTTIELAYDTQEIWHLRTSKEIVTHHGKFYPELRLKKTEEEMFVGFGIGFTF